MALMERVATLLRANVNDLIDRAEDPEKMLKQLLLDMENQLLQVKTQVAIAIADGHLLEKRVREQEAAAASWRGKAELAVSKGEDELARLALERALSHDAMAHGFGMQLADQKADAEGMRMTYTKLQGKLKETEAKTEMMLAELRRARTVSKATAAQQKIEAQPGVRGDAMGRLKAKVERVDAENFARRALAEGDSLDDRFARMERDEKVERLLDEIKQRQGLLLESHAE
jgi:phage shock protein A